jgi:hypothetical protein
MQVIRKEQEELLKAYKLFKQHGWIVERGQKDFYSGTLDLPVRLYKNGQYTPWFHGQSPVVDKNLVFALVCAELAALTFAAVAYDVPFKQEYMDESAADESTPASVGTLTKWGLLHEMGSTISDVEMRLYGMGVDMAPYLVYKERLNAQGKRITKEKMAEFFFPDGGTSRVKPIKVKSEEKPTPPQDLPRKTFKAEF